MCNQKGNTSSYGPTEPVSDDNLLCEAADAIDNAAHALLTVLSAVPMEWNTSLIAKVVDAAEAILKAANIPACRPWEDEDQHICYSLPDERCAHCPRQCHATKDLTIAIHGDDDIVMSMYDGVLRVDWYNAGEGVSGDYDPDDPEDINLLRFDVYIKGNKDNGKEWLEVTDASYCTNMPADTPEPTLEKALRYIFKRYREVINGPDHPSVKKLGEGLSHISAEDFPPDSQA